jgi:hypothetical protein
MEDFMSKKMAVLLAVSVLFCATLFAEKNSEELGSFLLGGGLTFLPENIAAGNFEFGFLLFNRSVDIRNHILLRAGGFTRNGINYGLLRLSEKISLGAIAFNNLFRFYTFGEGGLGFFAHNKDSEIFAIPVTSNFGGGAGADIFYTNDGSFYLELGYMGHMIKSEYRGGILGQIGFRA